MKVDKYNNSLLASLAYAIIIIAGLKAGSSIIVPLLMALFWFLLFLPLVYKLRSFGISDIFTTIIAFGITLIIVVIIGTFFMASSQDLVNNLPEYQEKYYELIPKVSGFFKKFGISLQESYMVNLFDPIKIINYLAIFIKSMGSIMTNGLLTLLMVMFLFLESSLFSKKVLYFTEGGDKQKSIQQFLRDVNIYFLAKTATSAATGLIVWSMLSFFDLDYALLLGMLAFFLNYIPNIGSIIAALPALIMALLQLNLMDTMLIAVGYIIINMIIGNFIEPKIMGKGAGLSAFVVFVSMVFWGWLFGPVGMFLSVPLTIIIKMASDNSKNWQWISVILTDNITRRE